MTVHSFHKAAAAAAAAMMVVVVVVVVERLYQNFRLLCRSFFCAHYSPSPSCG